MTNENYKAAIFLKSEIQELVKIKTLINDVNPNTNTHSMLGGWGITQDILHGKIQENFLLEKIKNDAQNFQIKLNDLLNKRISQLEEDFTTV